MRTRTPEMEAQYLLGDHEPIFKTETSSLDSTALEHRSNRKHYLTEKLIPPAPTPPRENHKSSAVKLLPRT
jgi:hypothetical protein